jgi:molybdate transport system ATP-binding protein
MALDLDIAHPLRTFRLRLSLSLEGGTLALVGPSGAGKTSVLRAIAGLLRPERGRVELDGDVWLDTAAGIDLPPERRSVGFVFQDYALFPHLTVRQNVAFARGKRVEELLERLHVAPLADARPERLSGGERQRVALARALAREPRLLLLDEPLAALDAHTKATVRGELRDVLRSSALPTIIVTHDFDDAATLADRVGVLAAGELLQTGEPAELVAAPVSPFVASFTGANLLNGTARPGPDGLTEVVLETGSVVFTVEEGGGRSAVAVYPWEVAVARDAPVDSAVNHVTAPISSLVALGNRVRLRVGPLAAEITAASAERLDLREGDVVVASFKATAARLIPLE